MLINLLTLPISRLLGELPDEFIVYERQQEPIIRKISS